VKVETIERVNCLYILLLLPLFIIIFDVSSTKSDYIITIIEKI